MTEPTTAYRVGDEHPATARQPLPTQSKHIPIVWLVTHDLELRAAAGAAKYSDKLRGFNGRDALLDAYQEALDLAMYLRQAMYERERIERELTQLRAENESLRRTLDTHKSFFTQQYQPREAVMSEDTVIQTNTAEAVDTTAPVDATLVGEQAATKAAEQAESEADAADAADDADATE